MLTIHQLKVFVTVAEAGSVRAAAERLVVTQPAVSASLAALEREMGAALFARAGRGIELTEAGRTMARYAQLILGLVDEATAAVTSDGGRVQTIRLAASTSAADHVVTPLLARLRDRLPEVAISFEIGNRERIWQLLVDRAVDVAVTGRPPVTGDIVSVATRANELVLVARPGTVWRQRLHEATFLLREPGSGSRSATEEVIAALGITPPTMTVGSNTAIRAAAESGLGVALLPRDTVAESLRARTLGLVPTPATPMARPWHVVVRGDAPRAAGVRAFVDEALASGGFSAAR